MQEIQVPEDLSKLSDDKLRELQTQIQNAAGELGADPATNADALESLAADYERIGDELVSREEAAAERASRGGSALSRIIGSTESDAGEAKMDDGADAVAASAESVEEFAAEGAESDAETAETEELTTDEREELSEDGGDETEAADESTDDTKAEAEDVAGDGDTEGDAEEGDEVETEEPTKEEATAEAATEITETTITTEPEELAVPENSPTTAGRSFASLRRARPVGAAPAIEEISERPIGRMYGATDVLDHKDEHIDRRALAEIICAKHAQMSKLGGSPFDPIVLASHRVEFPEGQMLVSGERENYDILRSAGKKAEALVASGGNCAPLSPSYDFFRLAEVISPVEDCFPTVGAPRGGIRFIVPPGYRDDVTSGVRVTTEAEDAAGYIPDGSTQPKPCTRVECPDVEDCQVDVVSKCVTFGNLSYRVFPEQVEDFLARLDAYFVETKERYYLDILEAGSTAVNITPPYGATRGLTYALGLAAHAYRKRNHMPTNAVLDVLAPDTLVPFIKVDMVNDHALGLGFLGAEAEAVAAELFDQFRLNVCWYYDNTTADGEASQLKQPQLAGPLNPWPTTYGIYLFAPDTWVRLDLGVLDVGIVRDSTLNSTNDLQIFSEQWIKLCKVGIESVRLDVTLCPDGGGPEPHPLLVCAS
jgi:hypothetical protein